MARGRRARDLAIAQAESKVRYGPKQTALSALIGEAQSNYAADKKAAKSGARSSIVHARRARKPLKAIYNEATGAADSAASDVSAAFGNLGAAADPFRAATAREQGAARTRLVTAKASGLKELSDRQVEAKVGRQFALQEAKSSFRGQMGKLADQLTALGDEQGAYEAARIGALGEARANRRNQRSIQKLSGRNQRRLEAQKHANDLTEQTAKEEAKAKREGTVGGRKPATRAEERNFTANFSKALRYAQDAKRNNVPRAQAATRLTTGVAGSKEAPGIPSIPDQIALSAALDMAYLGVIQSDTTKRIRRQGVDPRVLPGINTIREQLKRAKRQGIGQR